MERIRPLTRGGPANGRRARSTLTTVVANNGKEDIRIHGFHQVTIEPCVRAPLSILIATPTTDRDQGPAPRQPANPASDLITVQVGPPEGREAAAALFSMRSVDSESGSAQEACEVAASRYASSQCRGSVTSNVVPDSAVDLRRISPP